MTLKYSQILVAVDGSKEAEWAFKKSVGIAERNNATLNLVNVIDTRQHFRSSLGILLIHLIEISYME